MNGLRLFILQLIDINLFLKKTGFEKEQTQAGFAA
jgi:hypothetical protein